MKIRLLTKEGVEDCVEIIARNYSSKDTAWARRELQAMFPKGKLKPTYYVAEEDNEILGFAGFINSWIDDRIYEIFWVNVTPQRQRQGIGRKLVSKLITEIKKRKDSQLIMLTASKANAIYYKRHFEFESVDTFSPKKSHIMLLKL